IEAIDRIIQNSEQLAKIGPYRVGKRLCEMTVVADGVEVRIGVRTNRIELAQEVQVFDAKSIKTTKAKLSTPFIVNVSVAGEKLFCCEVIQNKQAIDGHIVEHLILGV